jgi:glycerol-3-phosphate acyltransferase PlsY
MTADNRRLVLYLVLLGVLSYLIGAIPFGYLLVRIMKGYDVRTIGSKSLGATNVSRALGPRWFGVVFVLDFLKGFVPAFVIGPLAMKHLEGPDGIGLVYGIAAMIGHIWPVYLKFRGGKGVATAGGAVFGASWLAALVAAAVFLLVFLPTRYVSLGSMCACVSLPFSYWAFEGDAAARLTIGAFAFIALLVIWKHRTNIRRLLAGTENRAVRKQAETEEVSGA